MADKRIYEVVFIVDPGVGDDEVMRLSETVQKIITSQGGHIVKTEMMGRRQLAYEINHKREGTYILLEIEGSGAEIAELERARKAARKAGAGGAGKREAGLKSEPEIEEEYAA